jgi:uncharacterized protein (TIGR02246 family)
VRKQGSDLTVLAILATLVFAVTPPPHAMRKDHAMKPFAIPLMLLLTMCLAAGCQSSGGASHNPTTGAASRGDDEATRRMIARLLDEHAQALLKHDFATMDRLWADDLTFVNYRGDMVTKAQRLSNLRTGATKFESINVSDQVIRLCGDDAAISTSRVDIKGQYSAQEGRGSYRTTIVWARRDGAWKMAALQMTRIGS